MLITPDDIKWQIINMKRKRKYESKKLIPFERSRKVIQLEKRGNRIDKYTVLSRVFGISGIACILYCGGIALVGFGTYFFLIWAVMGIGFLILSAVLGSKKIMAALPKWLKITCAILFWSGLLLFFTIEGLIFTQYNASGKPGADFCIILGAQWKSNGPSEVLRRRLDKAITYLNANPNTKVIVSGGQGPNEAISEALGMKSYLINEGIAENRILIEDKSSNTFENLVFSGELLDRENNSVVIVTNNFHVFRTLAIARKQGYHNVEGLAASSVPGMAPNNLLREFLGVLKDFMATNL